MWVNVNDPTGCLQVQVCVYAFNIAVYNNITPTQCVCLLKALSVAQWSSPHQTLRPEGGTFAGEAESIYTRPHASPTQLPEDLKLPPAVGALLPASKCGYRGTRLSYWALLQWVQTTQFFSTIFVSVTIVTVSEKNNHAMSEITPYTIWLYLKGQKP